MSGELPEGAALAGWIVQAWYEDLFDHHNRRHFGPDGHFTLASPAEYAELGEKDDDADTPLIMRRDDGALFEIDLDATATRVTPEGKKAHRELLEQLRRRAERRQAAREDS